MKKANKTSTFIALVFSLAMTIFFSRWFLQFNGFFEGTTENPLADSWLNDLLTEAKIVSGVIALFGLVISILLITILIKKFRVK